MAAPGERSVLDSALYRLGYMLEELEQALPGKHGAGDAESAGEGGSPSPLADEAVAALTAAAGGWIAAKLLRPRAVSWPRVVFAGVLATALHEAVRAADAGAAELLEEPEELAARLGSGIATTAAYAAVVYPLLPGPPLLRGLAFGAIEAATAEAGGTVALLRRLSPQTRLPLANLAISAGLDAGAAPHLAYGLGLGLFYRDGSD